MSAIGSAVGIPFFQIVGAGGGGGIPQYLLYNDGGAVTWRKGVRDGYFVLDKTLDATGFDGIEDTNWENVKSVISVSIAFITEWTVPNGDFTLAMRNGSNYNCTVDWGDGSPTSTITAWNDADATHTYTAGTYQISITGIFESLYIDADATAGYLDKVIQWGYTAPIYFANAFRGCTNLTSLPAGPMTGVENVISFFMAFSTCTSLTTIPTGFFDNCTSVTNFSNCFELCSSITAIPAGLFTNCTAVTGYGECFFTCVGLTGDAPELWNLVPEPIGTDCFTGCIGLDNYAAIPDDWKGL